MSYKIIYLAAYKAEHPNWDMIYQDINGERDIDGDMMNVDLTPYDIIIATPPCNWWSIANYRRDKSKYALKTRKLLPDIIKKLIETKKPFIVENVRNMPLFMKHGLFDLPCFFYFHGRHTYWTNIPFNPSNIKQDRLNVRNREDVHRQGGIDVHRVIEYWLEMVIAYD